MKEIEMESLNNGGDEAPNYTSLATSETSNARNWLQITELLLRCLMETSKQLRLFPKPLVALYKLMVRPYC